MIGPEVQKRKSEVALLSVLSNAALVAMKVVVGLFSGSVAILSEAIHSGIDLVASGIAFVSVRSSGKPADDEHPFGHGKYEDVSGAVEAILIFVAAVWIVWESVEKLVKPEPIGLVGWGVAVMFVSAAANTVVSRLLMKIGTQTDSIALRADAWHLRTDVYTSLGVMLGLAVIWLGGRLMPSVNLLWVDPIAAMLVALLIMRAAWHLTSESLRELLDARLSSDEEQRIRDYLAGLYPVVRGFHGLRTRKAGPSRFVECHVIVKGDMSVTDSHRVSDDIEATISREMGGCDVVVHVEPCDGKCDPVCRRGCLLGEMERNAGRGPMATT